MKKQSLKKRLTRVAGSVCPSIAYIARDAVLPGTHGLTALDAQVIHGATNTQTIKLTIFQTHKK